MAFIDAAVAVGSAVGLEGTAAAIGGGALMGAGTGALINGITGRSVLNGALIGGAFGGLGGGLGAAFGGAGTAADALTTGAWTVTPEADIAAQELGYANAADAVSSGVSPSSLGMQTAAQGAAAAAPTAAAGNVAYDPMQASQEGYPLPSSNAPIYGPNTPGFVGPTGTPDIAAADAAAKAAQPSMFKSIADFVDKHPYMTAAGVGAALLASQGRRAFQPNYLPTYTPPSAASYGLGRTMSASYQPTFAAAEGGIAKLAGGGMTAAGITGLQAAPQSMNPMYIQSLANEFDTTPEMAQQGLSALQTLGIAKAKGGSVGGDYNLGSYSDGGRLLKGPGDGMSDDIPASIADKQPARLADGEFVVPADVVSHLGNGSTDAGAKHLYKMMDNVRKARTGRKAQGKKIKADKFLPK